MHRAHSFRLDVGPLGPHQRIAADDWHLHGCHAYSVFVGGNVVGLFVMLFIVYWCYGTQLSVNGATAADFWGTKNLGINYGMLFTAWGVAGLLGGRIGGKLYDRYITTRWRSILRRYWRRRRWYANS